MKLIKMTALATSITLLSLGAVAVENANFEATVTVQNAFTLTNDAPLSFGTIRASADTSAATVATMVVSANPAIKAVTTNGTDAVITSLTPAAPATFSVSGVAAFSFLSFNLADAVGNITAVDPVQAGTAFFKMSDPSIRVLTGGNADTNLDLTDLSSPAGQLQVDSSGEATFSMGATLTTSSNTADSTTIDYNDGDYSGTFALTLEY